MVTMVMMAMMMIVQLPGNTNGILNGVTWGGRWYWMVFSLEGLRICVDSIVEFGLCCLCLLMESMCCASILFMADVYPVCATRVVFLRFSI